MKSKAKNLALIGANGRLGSAIAEILEKETNRTVRLAEKVGRDHLQKFTTELKTSIDVILDVSLPQAGETLLKALIQKKSKIPYIIGSTGWSEAQFKSAKAYSKQACVIFAPNFSPAVNLFFELVQQASPLFANWGYTAIVHETHHSQKKDAPSGTAKAIVDRMNGLLEPQVHSSRAGKIVGTHEVTFVGPQDIFKMTHEALDRSIFARGAVLAAEWASSKPKPGMFSMSDVINT